LSDRLGIERAAIVGKSPLELAEAILEAAGLPILHLTTLEDTLSEWSQLLEFVEEDEDERAAVIARQRTERLLRKIVHFFSSLYAEHLVAVLENPGSLNVPNRVKTILTQVDPLSRPTEITDSFVVDGWADLGFLSLLLRKFSVRLERDGVVHPSGSSLMLLTAQEHDSFAKVGTALQSYTHDRPSKMSLRKGEFRDSLLDVQTSLQKMGSRGVIPDEVLVLETGFGFAGSTFRGAGRPSHLKSYRVDILPSPGVRILLVASADCEYARCQWVKSPWPLE
jgi:hypothetical protein